jgi:hypothetical protein
MFARYAYAPPAGGYGGPRAGVSGVAGAGGAGADVDVPALARRFSGAWPYLCLIAELSGIDDPLDERVGRAYWTRSAQTRQVDARRLGEQLLERFGAQAGHYWRHLNEELLDELTPTHVFHVLGVYPWSRLLAAGRPEPLEVLDSCRIRPAEVLDVEGDHVRVCAQRLSWDGRRLGFAEHADEVLTWRSASGSFSGPLEPGDHVAVHWSHVCDRLELRDALELEHWTDVQLEATNRRLERAAAPMLVVAPAIAR